jgi:hypothetical protein
MSAVFWALSECDATRFELSALRLVTTIFLKHTITETIFSPSANVGKQIESLFRVEEPHVTIFGIGMNCQQEKSQSAIDCMYFRIPDLI